MGTTRWIVAWLGAVLAAGTVAEAVAGGQPADRDEAALVRGNSEFTFDLYTRLRGRGGNLFFSSYSISNALAMTYAGARGATATQMATALHFPLEADSLHAAFARVIREVNGAGSPRRAELHVVNALWPQAGFPIARDFQAIARNHYGAGLEPLDFRRAPETARRTINTWVEQQTQDRIKDLVPEGVLTTDTCLVLTNAIYFKGTWMHRFPDAATQKATFTLSTGRAIDGVPFMRQQASFRYLEGGSFQALELPYEGGELSMIVFLPRRVDGLAEFEQTLTAARVTEWLARMTAEHVVVTLPRFKVTAGFELKPTLTELGMSLPFSAEKADFSSITKAERLWLSAVIHKAYVEVSEQGTEAAAATGAVMTTTSAIMPRPPQVVFRADHPFFFVIREGRTGSLLFSGRVVNPAAHE
jgi:serine protease inhibitor